MPNLRLRQRRGSIVAVGVVVIVAAAGATAWAVSGSSGSSYRIATASMGDVEQTIGATGTISPVHDQQAAFQVSGTVAKVKVKVGDHVKVGDVLAHLDRSSLQSTVRSANSALASDRTRLSDAENGETDTSTATSKGTGGSGSANIGNSFLSSSPKLVTPTPTETPTASPISGSTGPSGGSPTGSSSGNGGIAKDQQLVRQDQQGVDQALRAAAAALSIVKHACAQASTTTTNPTATPTASPPTGDPPSSCSSAASVLLTDQTEVSKAEKALAAAETKLDSALGSALSSASGKQSSTKSAGNGKTGSGKTGSGSPSGSSGTTTVTAADIAADQATIDEDRADLSTARSDLAQATLRSTIAGRVSAVTISHGDTVSGSSSSADPAIEITGRGQDQVSIALSARQIRQVKPGMTATINADGATKTATGTVAAINAAGTASSTGDVLYPVTVTTARSRQLVNGAAAAVNLVVSNTSDVLTVPTSAVHRSGTSTYVELVNGGKATHRNVKTGPVGAVRTQITSGLSVGDLVVLANLKAAVPSSSSTLTGRGFSRTGGLGDGLGGGSTVVTGGGGFPPGGFTGGGAISGR